jgi:hypothetical protein
MPEKRSLRIMFGVALRTKLRNPGRLRANVPSNEATKLTKLVRVMDGKKLARVGQVGRERERERERESGCSPHTRQRRAAAKMIQWSPTRPERRHKGERETIGQCRNVVVVVVVLVLVT